MKEMRSSVPKKPKETLPVIADYALIEPWRNTNSGNARWSFAGKDGKTYFIKEFLSPVFPSSDAISKEALAKKRALCYNYYSSKRRLYQKIEQSATGNLVLISDFFLFGTKYYITTEKIEEAKVTVENIAKAPEAKKRLLLKILTFSLMKLHENGVVHADLKPNNILIKESESGDNLIAKIIDFDGSYLVGEQPGSEEIQGDLPYLAPETCRYMFGEDVKLTQKVDVFTTGLLFHLYLTGALPTVDKGFDYVHEALLENGEVHLSPKLREPYLSLVRSMIDIDPEKRPDMKTVLDALNAMDGKKPEPKPEAVPAPEPKPEPAEPGLKKTSLWRKPTGF